MDEFYEDDEPVEDVRRAFENGFAGYTQGDRPLPTPTIYWPLEFP